MFEVADMRASNEKMPRSSKNRELVDFLIVGVTKFRLIFISSPANTIECVLGQYKNSRNEGIPGN